MEHADEPVDDEETYYQEHWLNEDANVCPNCGSDDLEDHELVTNDNGEDVYECLADREEPYERGLVPNDHLDDIQFIEFQMPEDREEPTDNCPEHGEQPITGYGATLGPDPYGINDLACGHSVICLGPNEPNIIIHTPRRSLF